MAGAGRPRPDENPVTAPLDADAPIKAVLIDGAAIANHPLLRGGVVMEDVFEHENLAAVQDRRHATAMASVILRGDLRDGGAPINARILNIPLLIDGAGQPRSHRAP